MVPIGAQTKAGPSKGGNRLSYCCIGNSSLGRPAGMLQEKWLAHRQEASTIDYRLRFIELLAPLENVSEELSLGQFLNGLKEDIRT